MFGLVQSIEGRRARGKGLQISGEPASARCYEQACPAASTILTEYLAGYIMRAQCLVACPRRLTRFG